MPQCLARLANRGDLGCYLPMAFKNISSPISEQAKPSWAVASVVRQRQPKVMRLIPALLLALISGCGKTEGVEVVAAAEVVAPDSAPDALAAETRAKLLALAAASECLRKRDAPPDESAASMMALYRAHQVDLETYTREMSRLAGDPAFQAEVDALANACPTPGLDVAAAAPEVAVDTTPEPDTAAPEAVVETIAETVPETIAETIADTAAPDTAIADTIVAAAEIADTGIVDTIVDTRIADTIADTRIADTIADTRIADTIADARITDVRITEVKIKDDTDEPTQGGRDFSGNWTGQITGVNPAGVLRMTVAGRRITSAVATFGRTSIRLRGTFTEKGLLTLGGSSDGDSIHITGEAYTNGLIVAGSWDGTIDKRKGSGRIKMKR